MNRDSNYYLCLYYSVYITFNYSLQEALEKKQAMLSTFMIDYEQKEKEIKSLNQSLSQMSIDKEEMHSQLLQSQNKVDELAKKLAVERSVNENVKVYTYACLRISNLQCYSTNKMQL